MTNLNEEKKKKIKSETKKAMQSIYETPNGKVTQIVYGGRGIIYNYDSEEIRLRMEIKYLKKLLKEKDEEIRLLKNTLNLLNSK